MKRKPAKHLAPVKNQNGNGKPACDFFPLAIAYYGEIAETWRDVTCSLCKKTDTFKKEQENENTETGS